MSVRANRRDLRVNVSGEECPTVDILFDGHRVWSTMLPPPNGFNNQRTLTWPAAFEPYLSGTSDITVRDSASGEVIDQGTVHFGGTGRTTITDPHGRWLAINKWDRFGPTLEGDTSGVQERLLKSAKEIAKQMEEWGYPIYIVGGTLLGAVREGKMLGHDDDIDFAFFCEETSPQNITLVGFEMERHLQEAGYTVVRHSHTHREIVFFNEFDGIDYYIDIFTGYMSEDGLYNQPFALRGKLSREQLLPTTTIEIAGTELPAPAEPEAWLEYSYGKNWRIPDPSFVFETSRLTRRRFENEFGVFNRQRVYWEKYWEQFTERPPATDGYGDVNLFLELIPPESFVIDLGCGDGRYTERIAQAGHEVVGVDYSYEALRIAKRTRPDNVDYQFLNLNDRHSLITYALDLITQGKQPYFFARNLLHVLTQWGRFDLFVMLSGVLDQQTFMYATWDANEVKRVQENPQTWSLDLPELKYEAWRFGLGVTVERTRELSTPYGKRTNLAALVWL